MIQLDGSLTSDDMVFAVVLCLNGYHPSMERGERGVIWTLTAEECDEEMGEFVRDYQTGKMLVEPRRFAREHGAMRKDVYHLMGIGGQAPGTRVRRERSSS